MIISSPGVSYSKIGSLTAAELGALVTEQFQYFNTPTSQPLQPMPLANRGVSLYRVCYEIDVIHSDTTSRQAVSGLLVVPAGVEAGEADLPLAIYTHGTLFGPSEAPTNVVYQGDQGWEVGSAETLFNISQLAGMGYALIAPDYVGYGINNLQEGYAVKQPTTEAIVGLLEASRSALRDLGVRPSQLFIEGWSQGALNAQWTLQNLESSEVPVAATAIQSPFNEMEATTRWWLSRALNEPSIPLDPGPWLPLCAAILFKSYEYWYGLDGLFKSLVKDVVIPDRKDSQGVLIANPYAVTYREILSSFASEGSSVVTFGPADVFSNDSWRIKIMREGKPIWTTIPGFAGQDFMVEDALNQPGSVAQKFLQQLSLNSPRYRKYSSPLKAWYGGSDEALPVELVDPGIVEAGGPQVNLVPVSDASHRQTFLNGLFASPANPGGTDQNFIDWFGQFLKPHANNPSLVLEGQSIRITSEDFGILPIRLNVEQQHGKRPLHLQILRTRRDGTYEILGTIGGTTADASQLQSLGEGIFLVQVGDRLDFQLLSSDGLGADPFTTEVYERDGAPGYNVIVRNTTGEDQSSLHFGVMTADQSFTLSALDRIAAAQGRASEALLQLTKGQILNLKVSTDCDFENKLGFVKLNLDPVTGLPEYTVGSDRILINSSQFREQIDSLLDSGFQHQQGGRRVTSNLKWNVLHDGIYAPVLRTPGGMVFSAMPGNSSSEAPQQLRLLGQNKLSFEDLQGTISDYDWNDCTVEVTGVN